PSSTTLSNPGTTVTFTASLPAALPISPTGSVTFQDGASALGTGTLSGGTATFTTSGLTAGTHSITAIYGGDANFAGSTSPVLTQTVTTEVELAALFTVRNLRRRCELRRQHFAGPDADGEQGS